MAESDAEIIAMEEKLADIGVLPLQTEIGRFAIS